MTFYIGWKSNFQQHINEMFHVSNALRFCVKMRCQSHLYGWHWPNINIHLSVGWPWISILSQHYDKHFCWFLDVICLNFFISNFVYWMSFTFRLYFLFNFYYFKIFHFWSLVGFDNGKLDTCSVELTKYTRIRVFTIMWLFLF